MLLIGYIEDSSEDFFILSRLLENRVIEHYGSIEDYLGTQRKHDFIISDYSTPGKTNKLFKAAIEKEDCPFVIYTGACVEIMESANKDYYEKIGVDGFFTKGAGDAELVELIRQYEVHGQ